MSDSENEEPVDESTDEESGSSSRDSRRRRRQKTPRDAEETREPEEPEQEEEEEDESSDYELLIADEDEDDRLDERLHIDGIGYVRERKRAAAEVDRNQVLAKNKPRT